MASSGFMNERFTTTRGYQADISPALNKKALQNSEIIRANLTSEFGMQFQYTLQGYYPFMTSVRGNHSIWFTSLTGPDRFRIDIRHYPNDPNPAFSCTINDRATIEMVKYIFENSDVRFEDVGPRRKAAVESVVTALEGPRISGETMKSVFRKTAPEIMPGLRATANTDPNIARQIADFLAPKSLPPKPKSTGGRTRKAKKLRRKTRRSLFSLRKQ